MGYVWFLFPLIYIFYFFHIYNLYETHTYTTPRLKCFHNSTDLKKKSKLHPQPNHTLALVLPNSCKPFSSLNDTHASLPPSYSSFEAWFRCPFTFQLVQERRFSLSCLLFSFSPNNHTSPQPPRVRVKDFSLCHTILWALACGRDTNVCWMNKSRNTWNITVMLA